LFSDEEVIGEDRGFKKLLNFEFKDTKILFVFGESSN